MNEFLFVVVPYVCLTVFVLGHPWRYRYDKFGWTTRSSQLYESRLLRIGSPLFHFGILVVGGHYRAAGPGVWTDALGSASTPTTWWRSRRARGGVATVVGMAILIYRRRTAGPVFSATTPNGQGHVRRARRRHRAGMWNTSPGHPHHRR